MLGICNGFQILTEAGLLPGVLMRNAGLEFVCRNVRLKVETSQSLFTSGYQPARCSRIPVAHHDGNYFADEETLDRLEDHGQIAFRYCATDGADERAGQSQRLGAQHRRRLQRHQERAGPDAASGERRRAAAGLDRRQGLVRRARGGAVVSKRSLGADAGMNRPITPQIVAEHGLTSDEYERVLSIMGRAPNLTELGIFSVMWSEHCSYKSSRKWLQTAADHRRRG